MAMRAPRIMQRKRATPYGKIEPGPSNTSNIVDDDINEVLDSSGVYIQDGVMIRIQDDVNEERRILSEESAYAAAERFHAAAKLRRSITVDDSSGYGDHPQPYIENRLPGIADEVESYPCRLCDRDQVFLTGFGLEKHTRSMHNEHLPDVVRQIRIIGDEWKRRNVERNKIKERVQAVRFRHDSLAMAAAREFRTGSARNLRRWNADGTLNYVIPSSQLDLDMMGNPAGIIGSAGGPFESCEICHVQINVSHPTAHETHLRAHRRNDELRLALLDEYGPEFVERVSCHDCQLVFTEPKKLMAHHETMHVRRRKFICKWCGFVSNSVTDLNEHKIDVHAIQPNGGGGQRPMPMMAGRKEVRPDGKNGEEKSKNSGHDKQIVRPSAPPSSMDESHFTVTHTSCPECSLPFNRPSLLLKHMLRVHSKCTFNASIDTKGLPPFSVQVDRGRVVWSCCARDFNDRVSFSHHRQSHSISPVSDDELIPLGVMPSSRASRTISSPQQEVVVSSENKGEMDSSDEYPIDQSVIMGADGTIEIVIPPGVKHDENTEYMMIVEPDINGVDQKKIVAIDPNADPEEMMRLHGMAVRGEVMESTSREGVTIDGANYVEDENGQIIMSSEQFEQFTLQYGGDISNLNIVYMEDGHGNRIEDESVEENREEGEGGGREGQEDDANDLQHDILEPSES